MAVININGGQINIAGGSSSIEAAQVNLGKDLGPVKTQVNVVNEDGKIRSAQINVNGHTYNSTFLQE